MLCRLLILVHQYSYSVSYDNGTMLWGVKSYYLMDLRPTPGEETHVWYCKLSQEPVPGAVTALGESASITFIKGQSLKPPPKDLSLYP